MYKGVDREDNSYVKNENIRKGWTGRIIHILRMAENPKVLNVKGWNVGDTIN